MPILNKCENCGKTGRYAKNAGDTVCAKCRLILKQAKEDSMVDKGSKKEGEE